MNRFLLFSLVVLASGVGAMLLSTSVDSQPIAKALVVLQPTTPGTAQSGHVNITGTGLFGTNVGIGLTNPSVRLDVNGQVRCTAFRLNSGGGLGKVLTSDASGIGTWQGLPAPTLTLPYSGSGSSGTSPLFLITNTGDSPSIRGDNSAPTGTGVQGINSVSTGTGIGVYGQTNSPDGHGVMGYNAHSELNAAGYLGSRFDTTLTGEEDLSVGAMGVSPRIGVYGKSTDGAATGVVGESSAWIGVGGWTNSGSGVSGISFAGGAGVRGWSVDVEGVGVLAKGAGISPASQGTALQIVGGAIEVTGAGVNTSTPVFIHRATASNILANYTTIDHPLTNDDPSAILIITPNWNPGGSGGTYNNHATGVFYAGNRWAVFNQDSAAMPVNAAFNVLVVKATSTLQREGRESSGMVKPDR